MICRLPVLIDEHNARVSNAGKTEQRLTQRKLAKLLGVATTTIGRLYRSSFDRIDVETIEKICDFFNCDVGDLFAMRRDDH